MNKYTKKLENGETYQGWSNYATWRIMLEIFGNMDLEDFEQCIGVENIENIEVSTVADNMKEYVTELLEEQSNKGESGDNLVLDYALAFINDCNWYEMAQSRIDDIKENI